MEWSVFAEICLVLGCVLSGGLAAPSFTSEPGNVTAEDGAAMVQLDWQVDDDGSAQLFEVWTKLPTTGLIKRTAGGDAEPFEGFEGKFEIEGVATLKVLNVNKDDAGQYQFQASYDDGTSLNSVATLTVNYQPTISDVSATPGANVNEGDDLTLTCAADGVPAPTFTWSKSDGDLPGTAVADAAAGTLVFSNISRAATGTYTCSAGNGVGDAQTQDIAFVVSYPTTVGPTTPRPTGTTKKAETPKAATSPPQPEPTSKMAKNGTAKGRGKGRGGPGPGGLSSAAIAGIVCGVVALVLTIAVGAYCASKRFGPQPDKKPDVVTFTKVEEAEGEPLKDKDPENPPEKTEDKNDVSIVKNGDMEDVPLKSAEEA